MPGDSDAQRRPETPRDAMVGRCALHVADVENLTLVMRRTKQGPTPYRRPRRRRCWANLLTMSAARKLRSRCGCELSMRAHSRDQTWSTRTSAEASSSTGKMVSAKTWLGGHVREPPRAHTAMPKRGRQATSRMLEPETAGTMSANKGAARSPSSGSAVSQLVAIDLSHSNATFVYRARLLRWSSPPPRHDALGPRRVRARAVVSAFTHPTRPRLHRREITSLTSTDGYPPI